MKKQEIYQRSWHTKGEGTYNLIEQGEAICAREKISFNQLLRDALSEYVVRHGAGNNSFQLDKFGVTWTKAQSVDKCGFVNCESLAVGVGLFTPKNQTLGLCQKHYYVALSNSKVWKDLKMPNK